MRKIRWAALIFLQSCNSKEPKLYAFREAPIGGEYFKLLNDSLFEYGFARSDNFSTGKYLMRGDTIILTYKKQFRDSIPTKFLVKRFEILPVDGEQIPLEIISGSVK